MSTLAEDLGKITLKEFEVANASTAAYPGTVDGKQWTPKDFKKGLRVEIVRKVKDHDSSVTGIGRLQPQLTIWHNTFWSKP